MKIYFEFKCINKYQNQHMDDYENGSFQNFRICEGTDKDRFISTFRLEGDYIIHQEYIDLEQQALQPYGDYYLLGLHDFIKKHLRQKKLERILL